MKFESLHKRTSAPVSKSLSAITLSVKIVDATSFSGRTGCRRHSGGQTGRHRGQALLLAVLLMVFAALLGSTFITVVALNLNQTGRDRDKSEAKLAAQAGIKDINQKIVNSIEGEKWRPEMVSPPPDFNDASYESYYTPFERAQGWALGYEYSNPSLTDAQKWAELEVYKTNPLNRVFVKFPDPRQLSSGNSPTYLAEVTKVTAAGDTQGMLRITVIGRSNENDVIFARGTAFKGTSANGSPFSFASYTGNYDYNAGKPVGTKLTGITVAPGPGTAATLSLQNRLAVEPGRTLMLWNGTNALSVVCGTYDVDGKLSVTSLDGTISPTLFGAGTEVRATATLMDGLQTIDPDGYSTTTTSTTPTRNVSATSGVYANGALRVDQKVSVSNSDLTKKVVTVKGPVQVAGTATATVDGSPWTASVEPAQVHSETNDPANEVRQITPPTLDSGSDSRYRLLTQSNSSPTSFYGYGRGVYIDNANDVEKILTTANTYRPLRDYELYRLWQRKPFSVLAGDMTGNANLSGSVLVAGTNYHALAYSRLAVGPEYYPPTSGPLNTAGSLEQRGLRGWVSPTEFRPRGVQIDLRGNTIIIERDHQSDASGLLDDPANAWRNPDGSLVTGTTNNYRMKLVINNPNTPSESITRSFGAPGFETAQVTTPVTDNGAFNGVIFAEGNVRIRGYLGSKDLTVVSMGNIYVDGSIIRDVDNPDAPATTAARIALLARRNVTLNPTQVFPLVPSTYRTARSIGTAVTVTSLTAAGASSIDLNNVANLLAGDQLRIEGGANQIYTVTSVNATTAFITPNLVRDVAAGSAVSVRMAGTTLGTNVGISVQPDTTERLFKIGMTPAGASTLVRDVKFDGFGPANPYYITVQHSGQNRAGIELAPVAGYDGSPAPIPVYIKADTDANNVINPLEKTLAIVHPGTGDLFRDVPSFDLQSYVPSSTRGEDTDWTLDRLKTYLTTTPALMMSDGINPKWTVTIPGSASGTTAARRLAAVNALGATDTAPAIIPQTTSAGLYLGTDPMASSVLPTFTIGSSFNWANTADPVTNPAFPAGDDPTLHEILGTVSEGFYRRDTAGNQQRLQWYTFPTAVTSPAVIPGTTTDMTNPVTFTVDTSIADTATKLPDYQLGEVRIEQDLFDGVHAFKPGMIVRVQAAVFAQNGTWFVIPTPLNIAPDLNGNGDNSEAADLAAGTRYRRLNYQIAFRGTIAQNLSPSTGDYDSLLDVDGQAVGAYTKWLDTTAYPVNIEDDGSGNYRGTDWCPITYLADPIPANTNLLLPVVPDLIYSSS